MTGDAFPLVPHWSHPPVSVSSVEARITGRDENWLRLRWRIEGGQALVIPPFAGKGRADGLWQTTCFELFVMPRDGLAYCEFNLSPSERWAAYDFDGYRDGMRNRPVSREPVCTMRRGSTFSIFDAAIPVDALPDEECAMGLAAVLEEQGGVKSYWTHVHGDKAPDFHASSCFMATLAARDTP